MGLWRVPIDEKSGKPRGEPEAVMLPSRFAAHYTISRDGSRMLFSSIDLTESLRVATLDPHAGTLAGAPRAVLAPL